MAHELATTNGQPALMYSGNVPWHGLGTRLAQPATAAEAIAAAGLNFCTELKPLQTADGLPVPQRQAVIRSDSGGLLGVVGRSYVPVQNQQAFEFLDAIVADGGLRYHTAGALGHGERVWMLAKLPDHIRVNRTDDIAEKFLLLSNSHDGTSALRVHFTPVRVVCSNTLAIAAQSGRGQGVSIIHRGDLRAKVRQAREVLGLAHRFYETIEPQINRLASHSPQVQQLAAYFQQVYPDSPNGPSARTTNVRQELLRLFEQGRGHDLPGIRHTTWAAFNAVTEFVDHHRATRGRSPQERASHRLESAWFGSGAKLKERAWWLALQMAT